MNKLKEDIINELLIGLKITEQSIEQNFCKYFIKTKLMHKQFSEIRIKINYLFYTSLFDQ
jgi:hypothetical protein